ncbi:MAG: nucleotidyltransferase domain-containing protein [Oscillospiraceae bacterium]|nr:nucleotidyltransferase domain-containing protein [Oscillospiraceae bacterium]
MSETLKIELDKYVGFISSLKGVLQIYLFGSYANGKPNEASDIDLMIIIENNLDPFKIAFKIRRKMTDIDFAVDIVVNRKSAFDIASENSSFQKSIKENGVLLYAA